MDLNLKSKTFVIPATLIGVLVLIGAASTFVPGSIVDSSKVEEISFYHVTDGAYAYDTLQDNFDDHYAGVHGDNARVGDYRFIMDPQASGAAYGSQGADGCFLVPRVERNGQVIDDYNLQDNKITRYSGWVDKDDTDNRVQQYGDVEARFAVAFYMESAVYYGTYYGVEQCYGPFNQYSLNVPFDQISMTTETPRNVSEGEPVTVQVRFENDWKPLEADLSGEACIGGSYCSEFNQENVSIPVGGKTVSVSVAEPVSNFSGEVSVDMGGSLGLDMEKLQTENVVTDCDGDGVKEDASKCDTVKIADLDGDQVVNVVPKPEKPPKQGGLFEGLLKTLQPLLQFLSFR